MYELGSEKLDAHLDVLKIVKSLKKLKILMENNSMMTEEIKKQIKHSDKNVLYLSDDGPAEGNGGAIEIPQVMPTTNGNAAPSFEDTQDNQKLVGRNQVAID